MDIQLQNKTKSNHVYAYITGLALDKGNHVCVMKADGKTPYYPDSPSKILQPLSENCSIKLGAPGSTITVTIPQLAGGRIWFSVDNELKVSLLLCFLATGSFARLLRSWTGTDNHHQVPRQSRSRSRRALDIKSLGSQH